jgi:hypothetical protein
MRPSELYDLLRDIDRRTYAEHNQLVIDFLAAAWPTTTAQNGGPPIESKHDEERRDEERRR